MLMESKMSHMDNSRRKLIVENAAFFIFRLLSGVIVTVLFIILAFIIIKGINVVNWDFLTTYPTDGMKAGGIYPAIVGTFCLVEGDDPTYAVIEDGRWLDDDAYATIHRLASNGVCRGVARAAVEWSVRRCPNLRIDTHADNAPMLAFLRKAGFVRCGTIYCRDGTPRIAFQRHDRG